MLAFHGDPAVKAKYLGRVQAHAEADRLIQGQGWEEDSDGVLRGCAVGCTLEAYDHALYPIELGVPIELARLEDRIFESLNAKEAMKWPAAFLSAIPVGADLAMIWPRFAVWILRGLPEKSLARADVKAAVSSVLALYDRWIETNAKPTVDEWRKARDAYAYAASASAASASAASAAAYAAYAAYAASAAAAAYAAYAAYAAAAAAARSLARRKFWTDASNELLRLLRSA